VSTDSVGDEKKVRRTWNERIGRKRKRTKKGSLLGTGDRFASKWLFVHTPREGKGGVGRRGSNNSKRQKKRN
jgi:hypothetical protein